MITKKETTNYWFKIEPYVHISIVNSNVLLYNTFDGSFIESTTVQRNYPIGSVDLNRNHSSDVLV